MDDEELTRTAALAGLEVAAAQFPDDLRIAIGEARKFAGDLDPDIEPAAEPWPPMKVGFPF